MMQNRLEGMWLGKSIGGTLGLPYEGWLEPPDLEFYDPVPLEPPPNDDVELQMVWLHLLEQRGLRLGQKDFAEGWIRHIHYMWDEYGRCRWNLATGIPATNCGTHGNPFHAGMGSPIRSEIWASLYPGQPELAATYARLDASLDHGDEGIVGEMFLAAVQSRLLAGVPTKQALADSMSLVSPRTETGAALRFVQAVHRVVADPWEARGAFLRQFSHHNFTHAPTNLGLILWALLYSEGDFSEGILLAARGGYDTDCTAATVGAILGAEIGREGIPPRWLEPIGERILLGEGILEIDGPADVSSLTERILRLQRKIDTSIPPPRLPPPLPERDLADTPWDVTVRDESNLPIARWRNGQLPESVLQSGVARWTWTVNGSAGSPFRLICLAPEGARLWIDGQLLVNCPPGTDFIPATHRCPAEACATFVPEKSDYEIRVELPGRRQCAQAEVLLTDSSFHLAPWNGEPLRHPHQLPASLSNG
jgi:ADP-ribosylglycohydrolase